MGKITLFFYLTLLVVIIAEYLILRSLVVTQRLSSEQQSGWPIAGEIARQIAELDPSDVRQRLAEIKLVNPKIEVLILDTSGQVIMSTVDGFHITPEGLPSTFSLPMTHILSALEHDPENERRFPFVGPVDHRMTSTIFSVARGKMNQQDVFVYVPLLSTGSEIIRRQAEAWYVSLGGGVSLILLFLIAASIGGITFHYLSQRFNRFQKGVGLIAAGDLSYRLDIQGNDEVALLGKRINHMADSLIRSLEHLQKEGLLREEMISTLSHDFKSPLSGIRLRAERVLIKRATLSDDDVQRYLEEIIANVDSLSEFVTKALRQFTGDAERPVLDKSWVSVTQLIENEIFTQLAPLADSREVSLKFLPLSEISEVFVDGSLLEHALYNLVDNAIHYSGRKSTVEVQYQRLEAGVEIRVIDDGPGISESDRSRIFERFYRGSEAIKKVKSGTGLGLSIVRSIVEAHDGTVSVVSEVGKGATFVVHLPLPTSS